MDSIAASTETTDISANEEAIQLTEEKPVTEYIEYVGPASQREIKKEHWEQIGVNDMDDCYWTFGNGFKLPKEIFSEGALNYLLNEIRKNKSHSFRIVTE